MYIKKKIDVFDKMFLATMTWMLMIMALHCVGLRILLVRGSSMQPTICEGELVVGWTIKNVSSLRCGDVITFHPIHSTDVTYVKRIVALPGDVVEARDDVLLVNGKKSEFSFAGTGIWSPTIVGDGCVFVLGDNRFCSIDSRIFGVVPIEQIVVRVIA